MAAQPRIISFQQQVQEADPDWARLRLRPWIYDFSNGRRFTNIPNPYTVLTSLVTDAGVPLYTLSGDGLIADFTP